MTTDEWLTRARIHKAALVSFVGSYHPASIANPTDDLPITAPAAEKMRQAVGARIRASGRASSVSPAKRLEDAIDNGNLHEVYRMLHEAWCGVPESTSAWEITGFKQAVDLLDDPPDKE